MPPGRNKLGRRKVKGDVRRLAPLLIVLVVALLGCSEDPGAAPPGGEGSPDDKTEESADPRSKGELLSFTRSGGFAGTTETITIGSDGGVEVEGDAGPPQELQLPTAMLSRIDEELQTLDWERAANEPPNVDCADCFIYDIRAGGQRVTTTAMGESGEELRDLIALIEEIPRDSTDG